MPDDRKEFEHESLQDRDSLVRYLHALSEGIQQGHLQLSSNGSRFTLNPPSLMKFDVQAKHNSSRSQIVLRLSWKNPKHNKELRVEPLEINPDPARE